MNTSDTSPSSHSNALTTDVCPIPRDSTRIEQLETLVTSLNDQLDTVREKAGIDLQNLANDLIAKNREIGKLQAQIVRQEEEEPEHNEVRELLVLWKHLTHRNAKCDISTASKRYKLAKAAIKRWGVERSTNAIRGLALKPYVGPRGRSDVEYLGSTKRCDVEHALEDETRMERCEQYWLAHSQPTLLDQPSAASLVAVPAAGEPVPDGPVPRFGYPHLEPESEARAFVRYAYADDCLLPYKPASQERQRPLREWDDFAPIDKVIAALRRIDLDNVKAGAHVDSWGSRCPAHDDRDPSLSIHRKPDGTVLLHCFAGCDTDDVLRELGLEWRDLWTGAERDHDRADGTPRKHTVPAHLRHAMRQLIDLEEAA